MNLGWVICKGKESILWINSFGGTGWCLNAAEAIKSSDSLKVFFKTKEDAILKQTELGLLKCKVMQIEVTLL